MEDLEPYRPADHGATGAQVLAAWVVVGAVAAAVLILQVARPG